MTDIKTLSDEGLLSLHKGVITALGEDDQANGEKPFGVRSTPDWRRWADMLEAEMRDRGIEYPEVPW